MNTGPTWNWQFLPMPADFNAVRKTARGFRRWWPVHGWKPGTTDEVKLRVFCARALHLLINPKTLFRVRAADTGGWEWGWAWGDDTRIWAKPGVTVQQQFENVFTLKELFDATTAMLLRGPEVGELDSQNVFRYFAEWNWFLDRRANYNPRAIIGLCFTLNNGWGATASDVATWRSKFFADGANADCDPSWPSASEFWQVANYVSANFDSTNFQTAFDSFFIGVGSYSRDEPYRPARSSWWHHRGPRHRRQRL